jgi:hypothetical protein
MRCPWRTVEQRLEQSVASLGPPGHLLEPGPGAQVAALGTRKVGIEAGRDAAEE